MGQNTTVGLRPHPVVIINAKGGKSGGGDKKGISALLDVPEVVSGVKDEKHAMMILIILNKSCVMDKSCIDSLLDGTL